MFNLSLMSSSVKSDVCSVNKEVRSYIYEPRSDSRFDIFTQLHIRAVQCRAYFNYTHNYAGIANLLQHSYSIQRSAKSRFGISNMICILSSSIVDAINSLR